MHTTIETIMVARRHRHTTDLSGREGGQDSLEFNEDSREPDATRWQQLCGSTQRRDSKYTPRSRRSWWHEYTDKLQISLWTRGAKTACNSARIRVNQTLRVGNNCALLRSKEMANAHHDRDDHGGTKTQTYYRSLSARGGPRQLGIQRGFVTRAYCLWLENDYHGVACGYSAGD